MVAAAAFLTATFAVQAGARVLSNRNSSSVVNATTCNGKEYVYEELAGYGFVVSDAVDKFGDNLGGLGSAIHVDQASWEKSHNGTYTGVLWALPDRGWWVLLGNGLTNSDRQTNSSYIKYQPWTAL